MHFEDEKLFLESCIPLDGLANVWKRVGAGVGGATNAAGILIALWTRKELRTKQGREPHVFLCSGVEQLKYGWGRTGKAITAGAGAPACQEKRTLQRSEERSRRRPQRSGQAMISNWMPDR
jgi:hypothetical protein